MVSKKSLKLKKCLKTRSGVDRLRQKNRPPPKIREMVGDDEKFLSLFPSYGMFGLGRRAKPLSAAAERSYLLRKQREKEAKETGVKGTGSGVGGGRGQAKGTTRKKAKGRKSSSSSRTLPPIFSNAPTVPHPSTTAMARDERAPTASAPQPQGTYHTWSIFDPPAPPMPADQHLPTAPAYIVHDPSYYAPSAPTEAHGQHTADYSNGRVQWPSPSAATVSPIPSPDSAYAAGNAYYAAHSPASTPDLEIDHRSPSTGWSPPPPPAFWSENPGVNTAPPSAHIVSGFNPAVSAAQDSRRSAESFNAVYQDFFVRRSLDNHHSSGQVLAPVLSVHYTDTPQQMDGEPAPPAYSTETTSIANTFGTTAGHGTAEQDRRGMRQMSVAAYVTQPEGSEPNVWSAPPAVAPHPDRERSDHVESATNDAHAYMQDSSVQSPPTAPAAAYYNHPSPPTRQSSYSELAQALQYPPERFTDSYASSSVDAQATTPRATAPSFDIHPSGIGYSPGQVPFAPQYPADIPISEEECARIFQECFDENEHLLSKISSLLLDMDLAMGQGYATYH